MMCMLNGMKIDFIQRLIGLMCSLSFMLSKDTLNLDDFGNNTSIPFLHHHMIYLAVFDGVTVLLLQQVDDFALACPDEALAKCIYGIIGS